MLHVRTGRVALYEDREDFEATPLDQGDVSHIPNVFFNKPIISLETSNNYCKYAGLDSFIL